jgi:hypothetical protein
VHDDARGAKAEFVDGVFGYARQFSIFRSYPRRIFATPWLTKKGVCVRRLIPACRVADPIDRKTRNKAQHVATFRPCGRVGLLPGFNCHASRILISPGIKLRFVRSGDVNHRTVEIELSISILLAAPVENVGYPSPAKNECSSDGND